MGFLALELRQMYLRRDRYSSGEQDGGGELEEAWHIGVSYFAKNICW